MGWGEWAISFVRPITRRRKVYWPSGIRIISIGSDSAGTCRHMRPLFVFFFLLLGDTILRFYGPSFLVSWAITRPAVCEKTRNNKKSWPAVSRTVCHLFCELFRFPCTCLFKLPAFSFFFLCPFNLKLYAPLLMIKF